MLTLRPGVKLNDRLSRIIWDLAKFCDGHKVEVTSGIREPAEQLHLIGWYAKEQGILFPEFDPQNLHDKKIIDGREVYLWQRTWSRLLGIGVIINPPLAAECLEDSIRPDGTNRKGQVIQGSPHSRGTAFDLSGNAGFEVLDKMLTAAQQAGIGIKSWLRERENNAVHVNIT